MSKRNIHIVPRPSGWAVVSEGSQRASSVHPTQAQAIAHGRQQAQAQRSELLVHGRNNLIRERSTYGKDPYPPKG